ncbi:MAG TPA: hypothetical protein VGL35_01370 [Rhizomicrobium sp.]|jgi:hypothetical protein
MIAYFGGRLAPPQAFWWLGAGLAVGAAGSFLPAPLRALLLAAGVLSAVMALVLRIRNREEIGAAETPSGNAPISELSPRAREIFKRLPDPLMLLDEAGRIILANPASAAAGTATLEGNHVSAVWRTPGLLEAIDGTARQGAASPHSLLSRYGCRWSTTIRPMSSARTMVRV